MLRQLLPLGVALLGLSNLAAAAAKCSLDNKCPKETPCCSQYGECGVGAYCLGGCDPRMSFSLDACVPAPVCQSKTYKMDSLDGIVDVSKYLGDASKADWASQGQPLAYNGNVLLTMAPKTVGTILASAHYMWYGTVKARMKTSRGKGVVTAFILLSDVKDEIDFEWVGVDFNTAQTNYYFQGITDYTKSKNLTQPSSSYDDFHTYEVRWTPEQIMWLIDGDESKARVVKKSDTWNATLNRYDFPQTPARVQLSLWPGGLASNAKGTVDWAGGEIDWTDNAEDIKNYGYYYATMGEVSIDCYKTSSAPGTNKGKGYYYNDVKATNDTVVDGDKSTILKSLLGSGLDMDKDYPSSAATASASATGQEVIPGLSGGGPGTNGQQASNSASPAQSTGASNGGSSTVGAPVSAPSCTGTGFQQSCGSTNNGGAKNDAPGQERALGASAFAALIAIGGMLLF